MKKILCIMIVLTALFSAATVASARTARGAVANGNRLYTEEKFEDALKSYSEAAEKLPDSDIVNFDMGTALYKNKSFKEAEEAFNKALASGKTGSEAKTNYNIGNAKYRQGQSKEKTDVRSAIELYKAALDHYQRAIELDEKDEDAKFNYEFVKKKLDELLKNEPPQPQQEKQDSSKKEDRKQESGGSGSKGGEDQEKEKKDQEKKEQQNKDQQKQNQQEKQDQQKKEQEQQEQEKEEQERQEREEQEKKEQEQQSGQEPKQAPQSQEGPQPSRAPEEEEGQMSGEEAGMLLEGQKQEEESQGELRFRRKMLPFPDVDKDW